MSRQHLGCCYPSRIIYWREKGEVVGIKGRCEAARCYLGNLPQLVVCLSIVLSSCLFCCRLVGGTLEVVYMTASQLTEIQANLFVIRHYCGKLLVVALVSLASVLYVVPVFFGCTVSSITASTPPPPPRPVVFALRYTCRVAVLLGFQHCVPLMSTALTFLFPTRHWCGAIVRTSTAPTFLWLPWYISLLRTLLLFPFGVCFAFLRGVIACIAGVAR